MKWYSGMATWLPLTLRPPLSSIIHNTSIRLCIRSRAALRLIFVSALFCRQKPGQGHSAGTVHLCSGARSREKLAASSSPGIENCLVALAIHKSGTVFHTFKPLPQEHEVCQRMVKVTVVISFKSYMSKSVYVAVVPELNAAGPPGNLYCAHTKMLLRA